MNSLLSEILENEPECLSMRDVHKALRELDSMITAVLYLQHRLTQVLMSGSSQNPVTQEAKTLYREIEEMLDVNG